MKTLTRIDGWQHEAGDTTDLMLWETKSPASRSWKHSSAWRSWWRVGTVLRPQAGLHLLPWILLASLSLVVPGFFLTLLLLLGAVAFALLAFVVCIQVPLRYLAAIWQDVEYSRRATKNDLSR